MSSSDSMTGDRTHSEKDIVNTAAVVSVEDYDGELYLERVRSWWRSRALEDLEGGRQ